MLLKTKKKTNKQTKKDIAVVLKTDLLLQSNAIVFAIVVLGGYSFGLFGMFCFLFCFVLFFFFGQAHPLFISMGRVYFPWDRINWIKEELSNDGKAFIIS